MEKEGRQKADEEILAKILPNLLATINPQIQESQRIPSTRNMKKMIPRSITVQLLKTTEKILKAA